MKDEEMAYLAYLQEEERKKREEQEEILRQGAEQRRKNERAARNAETDRRGNAIRNRHFESTEYKNYWEEVAKKDIKESESISEDVSLIKKYTDDILKTECNIIELNVLKEYLAYIVEISGDKNKYGATGYQCDLYHTPTFNEQNPGEKPSTPENYLLLIKKEKKTKRAIIIYLILSILTFVNKNRVIKIIMGLISRSKMINDNTLLGVYIFSVYIPILFILCFIANVIKRSRTKKKLRKETQEYEESVEKYNKKVQEYNEAKEKFEKNSIEINKKNQIRKEIFNNYLLNTRKNASNLIEEVTKKLNDVYNTRISLYNQIPIPYKYKNLYNISFIDNYIKKENISNTSILYASVDIANATIISREDQLLINLNFSNINKLIANNEQNTLYNYLKQSMINVFEFIFSYAEISPLLAETETYFYSLCGDRTKAYALLRNGMNELNYKESKEIFSPNSSVRISTDVGELAPPEYLSKYCDRKNHKMQSCSELGSTYDEYYSSAENIKKIYDWGNTVKEHINSI